MKVLGYEVRKAKEKRYYPITVNPTTVGYIDFSDIVETYTDSKALKISAVYRAVNVISDSIASLPIDVYKYEGNWKYKQYGKLYNILNIKPNGFANAFVFKKQLITNLKLNGNAYIYINGRSKNNEIKSLDLIHPSRVTIKIDNNKLIYLIDGMIIDTNDIVHIKNISLDGIIGISTLEYARTVLSGDFYADQHNKNFFEGGANLAGLLTPKEGVFLDEKQAADAKAKFINQTNPILGGKTGSVVVLSHNLDYKPISLAPKDAQLLETKEFNLLSIAQFFGVPLSKLFYTKTNKYNTVEAEQLDFLNTTILPLIEQIEIELFSKIFLPSDYENYELKFDVNNLLRLDPSTQSEIYVKYINNGVLSVNEVRENLNLNSPVTGGNRHFVQQNLQPLDNITNDIKNQ